MSQCYCFMYGYEVEELNLKLFKSSPRVYEIAKLAICMKELMKGFYLKKCNKPTKNGTYFKFELCEDQKIFESKYKELETKLEELKTNNMKAGE